MGFYLGLIAGLPPGVPGGGTTGMLSPEGGGVCFICGSTPIGGVMTPPERLSSELLDPLAGGTAGALGCLALSSSAATATVKKPKNAIARSHILPIAASKRCPHPRQTLLASAGLPASTTTSRIKPLWPVTKLSLCPYCASRAPLTMMSACGSNRLNSFSPAGHRLAIKDAPLAPGEEAFNQRQLRSCTGADRITVSL
jgi:hypothetical protein